MKNSTCLENEWTLTLSQCNSSQKKKKKPQSCTNFCGLNYKFGALEVLRDPMDPCSALWGALRAMRGREDHSILQSPHPYDQRV